MLTFVLRAWYMGKEILDDVFFMREAIKEARLAMEADEVPVGAVIVMQDTIIARGHNLTERLSDVTAHAEILCITAASQHLGAKYLDGCTLYVTIEPCIMCAGALHWAQLGRIVYGAKDEKKGYTRLAKDVLHPVTHVTGGVMEDACAELMKAFFKGKRT